MKRIGLISDTHDYLDELVFHHFADCDEIWHAGDFGTIALADQLAQFKPLRGVYGNIDGQDIRIVYPKEQLFELEGFRVYMIHIGGYPGHYSKESKQRIVASKPQLFICGHSHILKVITDKSYHNMLTINPGAAGKYGFHYMRTIMKFDLNAGKIENMKVIELGKRT